MDDIGAVMGRDGMSNVCAPTNGGMLLGCSENAITRITRSDFICANALDPGAWLPSPRTNNRSESGHWATGHSQSQPEPAPPFLTPLPSPRRFSLTGVTQ